MCPHQIVSDALFLSYEHLKYRQSHCHYVNSKRHATPNNHHVIQYLINLRFDKKCQNNLLKKYTYIHEQTEGNHTDNLRPTAARAKPHRREFPRIQRMSEHRPSP